MCVQHWWSACSGARARVPGYGEVPGGWPPPSSSMMPPPPPPQQQHQQQQGRDGSQSSVTDTARVALLATSRGAAELPSNPTTATQAVQRERLEKGIAAVRPPMLRQSMHQTFVEMLQGVGPSFRLLQDAPPPSPPTAVQGN